MAGILMATLIVKLTVWVLREGLKRLLIKWAGNWAINWDRPDLNGRK
jgi:hypothetical protein